MSALKPHGGMDRRITLQQPVQTQASNGELVTTWTTVATVWAKRLGAKGREFYSGGTELGATDEAFQIRWSPEVSPMNQTWRVLYNGLTYNVYSVDEVGRHADITILCKAGTNNG